MVRFAFRDDITVYLLALCWLDGNGYVGTPFARLAAYCGPDTAFCPPMITLVPGVTIDYS